MTGSVVAQAPQDEQPPDVAQPLPTLAGIRARKRDPVRRTHDGMRADSSPSAIRASALPQTDGRYLRSTLIAAVATIAPTMTYCTASEAVIRLAPG